MTDLNSVFLIGRLVRDAELKYSQSGTAICRFSVANTQSRKDGDSWIEEAHFFDAVGIGKRFDALVKYLNKGQQVAIHGTLHQNRWQDKQTGANRSKVEILVNDIQLVGSKSGKSEGNQSSGYSSAATAPSHVDDSFDDDITF